MTGSMTTETRYEHRMAYWRTPGGWPCTFAYREDTNDFNTLRASLDQDEYGMPSGLSGYALDIGGYLGSVGIGLAIDNPELRVTIVEPVPENCELIEENIALNEVGERVFLIRGAVGNGPVRYRFTGSEAMEHHAFVGNSTLYTDEPHNTVTYPPLTLDELLPATELALMKIDVEGAEWIFLDDPDVARVPFIVGEAHEVSGHRGGDIVELLAATHDVTLSGNPEGTCGFRAVRRA